MSFIKDIRDRTEAQIKNEVTLQKRAAKKALCPRIIDTDYKTFIKMEKVEGITIADMYGEDIKDCPKSIRKVIYNILYKLYHNCDIEYIDVTPYNFMEDTDGRVWVIDFGDAKSVKKDWYLQEVFDNEAILEWNPDFK